MCVKADITLTRLLGLVVRVTVTVRVVMEWGVQSALPASLTQSSIVVPVPAVPRTTLTSTLLTVLPVTPPVSAVSPLSLPPAPPVSRTPTYPPLPRLHASAVPPITPFPHPPPVSPVTSPVPNVPIPTLLTAPPVTLTLVSPPEIPLGNASAIPGISLTALLDYAHSVRVYASLVKRVITARSAMRMQDSRSMRLTHEFALV